jgi:hypothetical protein
MFVSTTFNHNNIVANLLSITSNWESSKVINILIRYGEMPIPNSKGVTNDPRVDSIHRLKKTILVNMCPMYGNVYRIQDSTFNAK